MKGIFIILLFLALGILCSCGRGQLLPGSVYLMCRLFRLDDLFFYALEAKSVTTPVTRGLAFACSAHGIGTARVLEQGAVEGAVSGLAIALMGLMTALVVPLFNMFLSHC